MTRSCAHVREAELVQKFADIARMKVHSEPLGDDAFKVDPSPAHHAVDLAIWPGLDNLRELSQLLRRKARLGTLRPVVDEPSGPEALKRWTQSRNVCRSMPPIFAAEPRSIPSRTAASDNSRRLWLTSFERRANDRSASAE
jgi:hypothetical protein